MSRYIDADKAIEIWKDQDYIKLSSQETNARIMLDAVPSADVVEVVRCKDCIYKERERCGLTRYTVREYDFCNYGVRKENEIDS